MAMERLNNRPRKKTLNSDTPIRYSSNRELHFKFKFELAYFKLESA
jgi:hypothetical protein